MADLKEDIRERTVNVFKLLIDSKLAKNKAEIARSIDIHPNRLTEIVKGRNNLTIELTHKICDTYQGINPLYLLGFSDEMRTTPSATDEKSGVDNEESASTPIAKTAILGSVVHPTPSKSVHPTVHPTPNFGLPKAITVTPSDREMVPMVPVKARAGYLVGYGDQEFVGELPQYSFPMFKNGTFRAFEVQGMSMVPTLNDTDIAVGRWIENIEEVREGSVYVIITKSEGIVVKRVFFPDRKRHTITARSDGSNLLFPDLQIKAKSIIEIWEVKGYISCQMDHLDELQHRVSMLEMEVSDIKSSIQATN
jgi:hypothetical protein